MKWSFKQWLITIVDISTPEPYSMTNIHYLKVLERDIAQKTSIKKIIIDKSGHCEELNQDFKKIKK